MKKVLTFSIRIGMRGNAKRIPPSRRITPTYEYPIMRYEALVKHDLEKWDKTLRLESLAVVPSYLKRWTNEAEADDELLQKSRQSQEMTMRNSAACPT